MMNGVQERSTRQSGFSLLEVLVAFSILALSLGVLMQIFSKAMTTTATGADYDRAAAVAETRLRTVGYELPLEPGVYEGEADRGLAWTIRIDPTQLDASDVDFDVPGVLYLVDVDVRWRDGGGAARHLSLSTMRLAAPEL
ncbi:prepilin-type N-terminal cleavage/methylation domain-containing protein [Thioflavicoccus mobilis 8321]|uniref:Prepilin-type N-terminal cleavage/methylation domain-containing protein n=1 Tax=Thioflavicoccus mobilis 8321 TaxID=765912 RepID=L0GU77_9GAMM|nr:type II secretion system protein [Thioflavicoccus mobilis]AGA88925.1 prepilin-type N-terminal cleavage/methylation domain-containing protein [Thioflavicoccus mobilis 8321]